MCKNDFNIKKYVGCLRMHMYAHMHTECNIQTKEKYKITFTRSLYAIGSSFLFFF